MKQITTLDILATNPCYDPTTGQIYTPNAEGTPGIYIDTDWVGTIKTIFLIPSLPPRDKLWLFSQLFWADDHAEILTTLDALVTRFAYEGHQVGSIPVTETYVAHVLAMLAGAGHTQEAIVSALVEIL